MLAFLRSAFSTTNLVWVLVMAPIALISTIEDFSNWQSALRAPLEFWRGKVIAASEAIPLLGRLPAGLISALYLAIFVLIVFFTFTFTVALEAQRQKRLAMGIDFGTIEADRYRGSAGNSLMEGAAGAALAGALGLSGPVGWIAALGAMGVMMATRWTVEQGERDRHAENQTALINARRESYIDDAVARFVKSERRRLLVGAGIALAVVVASFYLGPVLDRLGR